MTAQEAVAILRRYGTVAVRGGRYKVNLMRKYGVVSGWVGETALLMHAAVFQEQEMMTMATVKVPELPQTPSDWPALPEGYIYGHHRNATAGGIAHAWQHTPRPRAKDRYETPCGVKMQETPHPLKPGAQPRLCGHCQHVATQLSQEHGTMTTETEMLPEPATGTISPEAAAARLRLRDFTVRPHGIKWLVRQDGAERVLTLSVDDLALAARLAQAAEEPLPIGELRDLLELTVRLREEQGWDFPPAVQPEGWIALHHPRLSYGRNEPNLIAAVRAAAELQANYDRADEIAARKPATDAPAPFWASISVAHQTGHYWFEEERDGATVWIACGRSEPQTTKPGNAHIKGRCSACVRVEAGAASVTKAPSTTEDQLRAHGWTWSPRTDRGQAGYLYHNTATYESCWHPSHATRLAADARNPQLYELVMAGWAPPALGDPNAIYRRPAGLAEFAVIPRERIVRGRYQPRKSFDEQELQDLAESIKAHGIIDPVVVFVNERAMYELIAGERRTRAAEIAGLTEVPARIIEADDNTIHKISVFENIQRANLNPIEEGAAFERLAQTMSEAALSREISQSRAYIQQRRALARSAPEVQEALLSGTIDFTRARAIVAGAPQDHVAQRKALKLLGEETQRGRLVKEEQAREVADRAQLDRAKRDLKMLGWQWNTRYTGSIVVWSSGDRPRAWTGEEIAAVVAEKRRPSAPTKMDMLGLTDVERRALAGRGWVLNERDFAPWLCIHGFDLETQWLTPDEVRKEAGISGTQILIMRPRYAKVGWSLQQDPGASCAWTATSPMGQRELIFRWGQVEELIDRIERGNYEDAPEQVPERLCERCGTNDPHRSLHQRQLLCTDCRAAVDAEAQATLETRRAVYATAWQTWLDAAPAGLLRLFMCEAAIADASIVGRERWGHTEHAEIERRALAMDRAALAQAVLAFAAGSFERWPTWAAQPVESASTRVALPRRPHRPQSADVSVVLNYVHELERWADTVQRPTPATPAAPATNGTGGDLHHAMIAFEDALGQQDTAAAVAAALALAHQLGGDEQLILPPIAHAEIPQLIEQARAALPWIEEEGLGSVSKLVRAVARYANLHAELPPPAWALPALPMDFAAIVAEVAAVEAEWPASAPARLLMCRAELDRLADVSTIETSAYETLSVQIGDLLRRARTPHEHALGSVDR